MVGYNQKGYVGQSMSVRARQAYESGEMPLSKWSKQAIIEAMEYDDYSQDTIEKAKELPLNDLRNKALYKSSYHHTGKFANTTNFYSLRDEEDVRENFGIETQEEKVDKAIAQIEKWERNHPYETYNLKVDTLFSKGVVFIDNDNYAGEMIDILRSEIPDDIWDELLRNMNEHNKKAKREITDSRTYIVKVKL